MDSSFNF